MCSLKPGQEIEREMFLFLAKGNSPRVEAWSLQGGKRAPCLYDSKASYHSNRLEEQLSSLIMLE